MIGIIDLALVVAGLATPSIQSVAVAQTYSDLLLENIVLQNPPVRYDLDLYAVADPFNYPGILFSQLPSFALRDSMRTVSVYDGRLAARLHFHPPTQRHVFGTKVSELKITGEIRYYAHSYFVGPPLSSNKWSLSITSQQVQSLALDWESQVGEVQIRGIAIPDLPPDWHGYAEVQSRPILIDFRLRWPLSALTEVVDDH